MKILTAGFFHETMTFSENKSTMREFTERLLSGKELCNKKKNTNTVFGAFIDIAKKRNVELIFSINVEAVPSGTITIDVFDLLIKKITEDLSNNQDIDGIVLNLHGAAVVEGIEDPEAEFLKEIKTLTNSKVPITAVLDFHANIGQGMVDNSDALVVYKTYPHIDEYQCGIEAMNILLDIVENKIFPKVAFRNLPLISPLLAQGTYKKPMNNLIEMAEQIQSDDKVISVSLAPGFGYADIPGNGFSILVYTKGDLNYAKIKLEQISETLWNNRKQLTCSTVSSKEAVADAIKLAENTNLNVGPVILADVSDNPGGGAAGDGVEILKELIKQKAVGALVSTIWDAEVADQLHKLKEGELAEINLGGKSPEHKGTTLKINVKILVLNEGDFINKGPMDTDMKGSLGKSAFVEIDGIKIIIHKRRKQTFDREMIRFLGENPEDQKIIVIKSSIHYRADFEPISSKIIEVDSNGPILTDLSKFDYKNIRRPSYPLNKDMGKPF